MRKKVTRYLFYKLLLLKYNNSIIDLFPKLNMMQKFAIGDHRKANIGIYKKLD